MNEVKICGVCTPISDGESHIPQSVLVSTDQMCSSSSVQYTPEIEKKYVHRVYDAIAPHFSSTRYAKWPKVATFLNSLPSGSLVLDAGCGNGKYLGLNSGCFFIGCDISAPLINICADRGSRRKKAIDELVRVVKKGGLVLITVWAVEQEDRSLVDKWTPLTEKYFEEWIGSSSPHARSSPSITLESIPEAEENSLGVHVKGFKDLTSQSQDHLVTSENGQNLENQQEFFVPWHLPYHRAEVSGASACALANGLAKKDDKKGAVVYNRYYHVFSEGELERLVSDMGNAVVVDRFYDKSNWCIVLQKTWLGMGTANIFKRRRLMLCRLLGQQRHMLEFIVSCAYCVLGPKMKKKRRNLCS
ncbi:tRNA (carboxymethyluridine(34)-5-O)-methyltransferase [Camellia lanceoleosa]|uniref:tRNA (Carboxymethyluridine(34)-5-O)-methyltransferase n=1 Tax=Camellia lanceoleosa TaxID=1840588 RepID=A0ACC0HS27_9ERIC|nr:tRNA (carboxymethyluridine(34)-5-O)-methyltransferase [Camellia lanceoleosa]